MYASRWFYQKKTALKLTKGLGLIEVDIKVPEDIDRNEQQAAAIRPGIT